MERSTEMRRVLGEGIVVAVIDTGLDTGHPDIVGNVWTNPGEIPGNGIDDDMNGFIDDIVGWDFSNDDADPADGHGHGSHVSGTIAALANTQGIVGVAPYAKIMVLKGLSDGGSGGTASLAPAINYAAANLASITSSSWGGFIIDPVIRAAFEAAWASGVLNVAAAGNDASPRLIMPALFSGVMAVAAVDSDDQLASFSNYGVGTEVAAPGVLENDGDRDISPPSGPPGVVKMPWKSPWIASTITVVSGSRPSMSMWISVAL